MTPIARVVYSPVVHFAFALALVATLVIAMTRPQPSVVVVMPPPSAPAIVQPAAMPAAVFPYCYSWGGSWYGYCRD